MHPWRERLFRWFAPMARNCPLSPNAVTVLALALNLFAAWLLYTQSFLLAMAVLIVGGLADAFDGIVARVQHRETAFGDFLDHVCDRLSDAMLAAGWLVGNHVRTEIAVGVVIAVTLNGYVGTQIEATWHERNYDSVGRGEFILALVVFPIVSFILYDNGWQRASFAYLRVTEWMSLLMLAFALIGVVQRIRLATEMARE